MGVGEEGVEGAQETENTSVLRYNEIRFRKESTRPERAGGVHSYLRRAWKGLVDDI